MKWMKETRNENGTLSAQALLPTIEDDALLSAVRGGAETVHLYFSRTITNGGVTHEDSTRGGGIGDQSDAW